jgi:hypothetical protein
MVSAVRHASKSFFEHEVHVCGCAFVNSRHRHLPQLPDSIESGMASLIPLEDTRGEPRLSIQRTFHFAHTLV